MAENKNPWGKAPRRVRATNVETGEVKEFRSITDAARSLGKMSTRAAITFTCQGLQNTAYGYKWEYVE